MLHDFLHILIFLFYNKIYTLPTAYTSFSAQRATLFNNGKALLNHAAVSQNEKRVSVHFIFEKNKMTSLSFLEKYVRFF